MTLPVSPENSARGDQVAVAHGDSESPARETDWAGVRAVYETEPKVTVRDIVARFGTSKFKLQKRVEDEGWTLRRKTKKGVSRAGLIRRMLQAVDRQMTEIENSEHKVEQRVELMASMSRTLAKVLRMDRERREAGKPGKSKQVSAELTALREKIAQRIEQLNQD